MTNNVGGLKGALKNTAIDAGNRLQKAGEAIVTPTKIGNEGLVAFRTLRVLDNLADLLPPNIKGIAKALLGLGIQNVGTHGDPQAKEAVRGFTSMMAIKEGRVPASVLEQAAPGQRQAIVDAAKAGDVATVKSILRHNKKHGVDEKRQQAPSSEPTKPSGAQQTFERRLETFMRDVVAKTEGDLVNEVAGRLKNGSWSAQLGDVKVDLGKGEAMRLRLEMPKNGGDSKLVGEWLKDGKATPMSDSETLKWTETLRNGAMKAGGDARHLAEQVSFLRRASGNEDITDLKVAHEAEKERASQRPGNTIHDSKTGISYNFDVKKDPRSATRINADGSETKLSGADLDEVLKQIERMIEELRKLRAKATTPDMRDAIHTQLSQLRDAAIAFKMN